MKVTTEVVYCNNNTLSFNAQHKVITDGGIAHPTPEFAPIPCTLPPLPVKKLPFSLVLLPFPAAFPFSFCLQCLDFCLWLLHLYSAFAKFALSFCLRLLLLPWTSALAFCLCLLSLPSAICRPPLSSTFAFSLCLLPPPFHLCLPHYSYAPSICVFLLAFTSVLVLCLSTQLVSSPLFYVLVVSFPSAFACCLFPSAFISHIFHMPPP